MAALIPSQLYGPDDDKPVDRGSLAGSAALAVGSGLFSGVIAPAAEVAGEAVGGDDGIVGAIAKTARNVGDKIDTYIPEERRKDRDAAFFPEPGQRSVFQNLGSSLVMKGTSSAAPVAAYVASGSLAPIVGAALGAGSLISDTKGRIEKASEEELLKDFPKYAEYMERGLPVEYARKLLVDDILTGSMVPAAVGGAAGAVPISRAIGVGAKHGVIKGAGISTGEGALGGALEGAGREVSNQQGEMNVGKRVDYDPVPIIRAAANSGLEGGVFAGGMAGVGGGFGKARDAAGGWASKRLDEKTARDATQKATVDGVAPDPAQTSALTPDGPTALDTQIDAAATGSPDALKPPGAATAPDPNVPPPATTPTPPPAGPSEAVVNAIHTVATKRMRATEIHDAVKVLLGDDAPPPTEIVGILTAMRTSGELTRTANGYKTERKVAKTPPLVRTPITEATEAAKPPSPVETKVNVPGDEPSAVAAGVADVIKSPEAVETKANVPGDQPSAAALTVPVTPEGNAGVATTAAVNKPYSDERVAGMSRLAAGFARKVNAKYDVIAETQGRDAAEAWAAGFHKRINDPNGKFARSVKALGEAVDTMNAGVADRSARITAAGEALTGKTAPTTKLDTQRAPKSLHGEVPAADALAAPVKQVSDVKAKIAASAAKKAGTLTAKVAPKVEGETKTGAKVVRKKIPLTAEDIKVRTAIKAKLPGEGSDETARKVATIVKTNMARETAAFAELTKLQDEAAAKASAEAKASGKPSTFKRTELPPETPEARLERHVDNALAQHRENEADNKRTKRNIQKDDNETAAEEVARDTWTDENNKPRDKELADEARKALGGDGDARRSIIHRINNMLVVAAQKHVQIARAGFRTDQPEANNTTPWRKYLYNADKFNAKVKSALNEKDPAEKARRLNEAFTEFLPLDHEMRGGRDALTKETVTPKGKVEIEAEVKRLAAEQGEDASAETAATRKIKPGEKVVSARDALDDLAVKDDADVDVKERVDEGNAKVLTASERAAQTRQNMDTLRKNLEAGTVASTKVTLKEHLNGLGSPGDGPGDKALAAAVKRKLLDQGGDSIVHIVPDAVWDANGLEDVGGAQYRNNDPAKPGIIILPKRWSRDPLVVIHEGVHEITSRAVDLDLSFRADVRKLMDHVLEKIPEFRREYGFHNEHEFLAETAANPEFRDILRGVNLDKPVVTRWGIARTAWDKLIDMTFKLLGLKSMHEFNSLEMAMRAVGEGMAIDSSIKKPAEIRNDIRALSAASANLRVSPREYFEARIPAKIDWKLRSQRVLDKFASVVQMTNNSDHLFGADRPARQLAEAMGKMSTMKNKILSERAEPLIKNMSQAQRKFDQRTNGRSQWTDFAELAHDASRAGVHPDEVVSNQFKTDSPGNWYQMEIHKDLSARYEKMPQELKDLFHEATAYFRETQNQMSLGLIRNALKAASSDGRGSEALAQRIFNKKLTDADKIVLGKDGLLSSIQKAGALTRVEGPYVPFMRRGDFVVTARHEVEAPAGARRINDEEAPDAKGNTYEFKTEKAAKTFVQKTLVERGLRPTEVSKVGVDPVTESHYRLDAEGKKKPISIKEEPNAEARWRVTIEPKHVEFHEQASAAAESRQGLIDKGLRDVTHVDVKKLDPAQMNDAFMPLQMQRLLNGLQKREGFKRLDKTAQDELVRQLREAGIASMGSTRAQSHRLPRNNILGYSDDILKNTGVYASSTAGYLARLRYRPEVDAALKKMTDYTERMTHAGNNEYLPAERRQRLNELTKRAHAMNDTDVDTLFHRATNRLLQLSYLDKLASPAFHVINSSEPWTVTLPLLAARHGMLPTIKSLSSAYNLIGGRTIVGAGLRDTYRAGKSGHNADLTDYQSTLTQRVAKDAEHGDGLVKLFNHLHDVGLMSRDAGMELSRITDMSTSRTGRAIDRADLMARQVGAAVESVNRAVTATAAYKMERKKGASHDKAMEYAVEQVHDAMKDYAAWNAPPIFNHPVGRLALQFKKYAQGTYYLLGKTAIASFRGDKQAMKTFAYLMATHMVTAGALGMPLEPIRLGLMAAGLLGITDKTYEDFEQGVRAGAANVFGVEGGQIFSRGVARWAGIDLASRVSFNSLLTSGQDPKSMKSDDLWAWLAKNLAGAPTALLFDGVQGFQALAKGDVVEASRLLLPLKIWADSVQAYQWHTEGRKSPSGRQQMEPVSMGDAIIKAAGFTPGDVAERNEKTFAIKGDQRQFKAAREKLSNDWINASPDEKTAMWREITKWNSDQPDNAKIKLGDLMDQKRRRDLEKLSTDRADGMNFSKRDRHLRAATDYYNVPITR